MLPQANLPSEGTLLLLSSSLLRQPPTEAFTQRAEQQPAAADIAALRRSLVQGPAECQAQSDSLMDIYFIN